MNNIDLHTHTVFSDGFLTPKELLKKAKEYKLKAISICDHDTIKAYNDNIFKYAKKLDIELITGIEFSTVDNKNRRYHILGLLIELNNKSLHKFLEKIEKNRKKYAKEVTSLLKKNGWSINIDKLLSHNKSITKAHISRNLIKNRKNIPLIKEHFKEFPSEGELTEALLIKGKKYYIPIKNKISPQEAINIIHNSNGVAILAHPGFNVMNGENLKELCERFKSFKIDGFEVINIQYNKSQGDKRVDYIKDFEKYCKKNNLLMSGGSDFHHSNKKLMGNFIDLGFKKDTYSIPYSIIDDIKKFKNNLALSSNG